MPITHCPIVVLTRFHFITAEVELHDTRLSDLLNNERESSLCLADILVARLSSPARTIDHSRAGVILKSQIVLAFEHGPVTLSPARFHSFIKKDQHDAFMLAGGVEVRGRIHCVGPFQVADLQRFIASRRGTFLPVTQAVVNFTEDERFLIRQDAIMVNVDHIHYVAECEGPREHSVK